MAIAGRSYTNVAIISRNSLQDAPVLTTPTPEIVTSQPDRSWFSSKAAIIAVNPQVQVVPPSGPVTEPIVISAPNSQAWYQTNQPFIASTPQSPPPITEPIVISTPNASTWYGTKQAFITSNPQAPPAAPTSAPEPIVISAPNSTSWYESQAPIFFSNSQAPIATPTSTPDPIVQSAPNSTAWFETQGPIVLSNPQAPVIVTQASPDPVVISASRPAHFQFVQAQIIRNLVFGPATRVPLHLGGTVLDTNLLGGTVVRSTIVIDGAIVDGNTLGGTVVDGNTLSGTFVNTKALGGNTVVIDVADTALDAWTMQEVDIGLAEFNDESLGLTITSSGAALNITGMTVEVYLKQAQGELDTDPNVVKLSTATGEVTITDGPNGKATAAIASANLASGKTYGWYRVDLISGGKRNTALYGKVGILQL